MLLAVEGRGTKRRLRGQGLVEYALLFALIAIVVYAILMLLGPALGNTFSSIGDSLPEV